MSAPTISSLSASDPPPGTATPGAGSGDPGAAPKGSVLDLFRQLLEFQWKGISFPVTEFETDVRQDLVIHKFADRDGAYVECTGRHPIQVTATIPFLNTIYAGTQETWSPGNLYPYQWRFFLKACLEGTSGTLQHPELGPLNCKIDMARTSWKATVTGGVWVRATWIESDDTQADQLGHDLSSASPIAQMVSSADDLDDQIATLQSAATLANNPFPPLQYSFSQIGAMIAGVIDTTTILEKEYQGATDNLLFQCNEVEEALELQKNASPMNWPILQNCERLKAAAYALKAAPVVVSTAAGTLTLLRVQKDSTLGQLIAQTGSDPATFIKLNYGLIGSPVVPAGTQVQYYQPAA